ncbi:DoxX family protein [Flavobacterium sediminis]|uniref:DoxX family protein n=1 Tax=Flavobacterium sediminis TaxID=2201181 RepID=A0A2U8QXY2_9FLAO|nr:DoxX family protein [Flavobacterium sediminis]AWM14675.1 DoxX family protein [Flavobacterium sediminis]MBS4041303.1 DoxX family protein [Flavobacteriales bacterium]
MKTGKKIFLYLLVAFYLFMGLMHFIQPEQYFAMMPSWLPAKKILIIFSGIVEIVLAILLIPIKTRAIAAKFIIAMLIVFLFAIHIPESIGYYNTGNEKFVASIVRLPIQFLFIAWAWMFAKK